MEFVFQNLKKIISQCNLLHCIILYPVTLSLSWLISSRFADWRVVLSVVM